VDYGEQSSAHPKFKGETTMTQSSDQILRLFEGHLGSVFFRHEADPPDIHMIMTVFELRKARQ
jgi:hypothetical protein